MAKFVRKMVDEKELKLITDCKRGVTDKLGRPVAAIPQIIYTDGYAYLRVVHRVTDGVNRKSVAWTFATALGFDMETAYDYDLTLEGYNFRRIWHEVEW